MYQTECPRCNGTLNVVYFKTICKIPLYPDGFDVSDARYMNTEDEEVACADCDRRYYLWSLDPDNAVEPIEIPQLGTSVPNPGN